MLHEWSQIGHKLLKVSTFEGKTALVQIILTLENVTSITNGNLPSPPLRSIMDPVAAANIWFDMWATNWALSTGLPRETYLPAVVITTLLGLLSF
ncbi:hypothetical protein CFAEC_04230 [Corynebacterium faecale]|nr:hypothetical protein CFAEC_04230 [Corynebacterium faecale]